MDARYTQNLEKWYWWTYLQGRSTAERESPFYQPLLKDLKWVAQGPFRAGAGCPLASPVLGWGVRTRINYGKARCQVSPAPHPRASDSGPSLAFETHFSLSYIHTRTYSSTPLWNLTPVYQGPARPLHFYISLNYFRLDRGEERRRKKNQYPSPHQLPSKG